MFPGARLRLFSDEEMKEIGPEAYYQKIKDTPRY